MKKLCLIFLVFLTSCSSSRDDTTIDPPTVKTIGARTFTLQNGQPVETIVFLGSYLSRDIPFKDLGFEVSTNANLDDSIELRRFAGSGTSNSFFEFNVSYDNTVQGTTYYFRAFTEDFDSQLYYGEVKSYQFF